MRGSLEQWATRGTATAVEASRGIAMQMELNGGWAGQGGTAADPIRGRITLLHILQQVAQVCTRVQHPERAGTVRVAQGTARVLRGILDRVRV